jgi:hypothetical protein
VDKWLTFQPALLAYIPTGADSCFTCGAGGLFYLVGGVCLGLGVVWGVFLEEVSWSEV